MCVILYVEYGGVWGFGVEFTLPYQGQINIYSLLNVLQCEFDDQSLTRDRLTVLVSFMSE